MNNFVQTLVPENKKIFLKLKNLHLKIAKATSAVDFNQNIYIVAGRTLCIRVTCVLTSVKADMMADMFALYVASQLL